MFEIVEKNIDKEVEKKLKIKGYDLISFYYVKENGKQEINEINIPMELTYKKYKVVRIENEEIKEEIKYEYKEKEIKFEAITESQYAVYGKKERKVMVLPLAILLTIFLGFSGAYAISPEFRDKVDEVFINTLKIDEPSAPVITGGSKEWAKKRVIKVKKDAKSYGEIEYYEYCMSETEKIDECKWEKTNTKNMTASTTGKYYVVFRGVNNNKKGKLSNVEEVWIDNNAPIIEKVEVKDLGIGKIKVEIKGKDLESGIGNYYYKIDEGEYKKVDNNFEIKDLEINRKYKLTIRVEDKVLNSKEVTMEIKATKEKEIDEEEAPEAIVTPEDEKEVEDKEKPEGETTTTENPENPEKPEEDGETKPEEKPEDKEDEKEELIVPEINLDEVPVTMTYGEKYELPSYYKFGPEGGEVECKVRDKVVTNTEELTYGKHLIICTAKGNNGLTTMVSKEVEVKLEEGEEEVWDGWIKLNLYYPDNSTNWQWRLGKEGEIRTGYEDDGWEDYTGPILVKLSDVENIYIRYDLNGENVIVAPKGKLLVDIQPEKYTLNADEKTKIKIVYEKEAKTKEYRVGAGEWKEYTTEFEVGINTLIEARVTKEEKIYDSEGNYVYTKKLQNTDAVWIGEYTESPTGGTSPGGPTGGPTGGIPYGPIDGNPGPTVPGPGATPSTYLAGPAITSNPSEELVESTKVKVTPQEVADKIYVSVANGAWQEYTEEIEVNKNTIVRAYYIRYKDGMTSDISYYYVQNIKKNNKPYVRLNATPTDYLTETQDSVEVSISGSEYDTLEYSLDGTIYTPYTSAITVEESATVYARGRNAYGETVESLTITTTTAPKEKEKLFVHIEADPSKEEVEGLVNQTEISINYDPKATKKYYKIGYYGEWKEYTQAFKVSENTTVYAYCTSEDGVGNASKRIEYLTTGISDPIINVSPLTKTQYVKVEIEYDKNAEIMRYQIGNGPLLDYVGPFYVTENTTITAYNKNTLGYEAESKRSITNIVPYPEYTVLDAGKYFIVKLNYPSQSNESEREYKWKPDGEWKVYDPKGILLIKPEYKDEIMGDIKDGIQVEDENGNKIIFTDHYYLIDVPFSELMENLFMRWNSEKIAAPKIYVSPEEPTTEVEVGIVYSSALKDRYYKIVYEDGSETNWIKYTGPFTVNSQNAIVYAKGYSINGTESKIGSKKITNVDIEAPEIEVKGIFDTPRQKVNVTVSVKDNMKVDSIKWAEGDVKEEYFKDNGTAIRNNTSFTVNENGKYTIYATDLVGNKVVKVIEITNIDKNAPDIFIEVLTEKYGTEAEISIDYGDAKTKQYRIGETSTTYQTYTENIIIKSNDVLDLVNEDGSLTIYAKGIDEAGNEKEVSERIDVLDLDAPETPIIHSTAGYPILTEYGVELAQDNYIVYDTTRDDITNYYSLDKGETWKVYTGPFKIESDEIWAKSVKKESGLTVSTTKKVEMPTDALEVEAYDGQDETNVKTTGTKIINVDSSMWNKSLTVKTYTQGGATGTSAVTLNYYNEEEELLFTKGISSQNKYLETVVQIPEGAIKLGIVFTNGSQYSRIYQAVLQEIFPFTNPVISDKKYYPKLTEYGVEQGYNKVTIDYFQTSVERLYRINEGEWKAYEDKAIRLELGDVIEAKGIDKNGIETEVSSYTSVLPTDALEVEAYDGKDETNVKTTGTKIINVDSSMWNKSLTVKTYTQGGATGTSAVTLNYYNEEEELLFTKSISSQNKYLETVVQIPEGAIKLGIVFTNGSQYSRIYQAALQEIFPSRIPFVNQTNIYPQLSIDEFKDSKYKVKINYLSYFEQKLYSLDNGETWNQYTKEIEVNVGDVIKAKAIDKDGAETEVATYTITAISDAINLNAHDDNYTSIDTIAKNSSKSFNITNDTVGRMLRLYLTTTPSTTSNIKVYDSSDNELETISLTSKVTIFEIPENSSKVTINSGSSALSISEINLRPILEYIKVKTPEITINDANWSESKTVEIAYASGYTNEYSIDSGNTWREYTGTIEITEPTTFIARSVDEEGNVISSSSFVITKIDNKEPTITLDIPDEIVVGSKYDLPTSYEVDETKSSGSTSCKIGEEEVTNTKDLFIGTHEIICTVTTGAGKEASVTKNINVIDEIIDISLEIPDTILVGSNYQLPTSVTGSYYSCKIGETEITNTKDLSVGSYEIMCNVTSIGGNTKEVTKRIEIYEETGTENTEGE